MNTNTNEAGESVVVDDPLSVLEANDYVNDAPRRYSFRIDTFLRQIADRIQSGTPFEDDARLRIAGKLHIIANALGGESHEFIGRFEGDE